MSHLYDRLLNNEVFGEDATARVAELSYAIALPGVLVALFLFPAYHGLPPHPLERSFLSQACDHLFFVTYAFVVMGCAVIFQWEMLFPDALDVSVMTTLPISLRRLLMGRITAVALFLLLVHAGTSGLGCLFLPAVADQRCGFFRQLLAQGTAVSMGGICIVAALVALQALLLWMPRGSFAEVVRAGVKVSLLIGLMTILFLFPLTAHYLGPLLAGNAGPGIVRWFPTFWFLGVYDSIMWGGRAPLVFHTLARNGFLVTITCLLLAGVTYPLGYLRRVKLLVEGSALMKHREGAGAASLGAASIRLRDAEDACDGVSCSANAAAHRTAASLSCDVRGGWDGGLCFRVCSRFGLMAPKRDSCFRRTVFVWQFLWWRSGRSQGSTRHCSPRLAGVAVGSSRRSTARQARKSCAAGDA